MTRRLSALFLALLLAGLLAPAGFASGATVSYYGVELNGVDGYIKVANFSASDPKTAITVGGVFKPEYSNVSASFINRRSSNTGSIGTAWRSWTISYNAVYERWSAQITLWDPTTQTGQVYTLSQPSGQAPPFQTYEVFLRWDGSTAELIVNGNVVASVATSYPQIYYDYDDPNATSIDYRLFIGDFDGGTAPGKKKIYLVLIYNRSLSDAEIQQIYNDPLHPPTTGLVLEYLPSSVDPATNTWVDESGNGNDGQINGATYVPLRPVSEFSESYALNFNRTDYVTSSLQSLENGLTVIQFVKLNSWGTGDGGNLFSRGGNLGYRYRTLSSNGRLWVLINNGTAFHVWAASQVVELHREVMVGFSVAPYDTVEMIYNGKVVFSTSYPYAISNTTAVAYIGALSPTAELIDGEVYVTLIYARKLSDQEIQQIYENPNNPPLDGLVLWYSPYSYDPSTGKWLNRAPIFPTIPLVEELDGVNYGATPERVSIPSTGYYDASNSSPISPLDVSVSLIENNTTISLIPSFLTLPYNETVTLNVSATGYESRTLSILTTINSLAVYLEPANKTSEYQNVLNVLNQTNLVKNLTANFTITPINPYAKAILDSGGSFGKTVELAIRGDDLVKLIMPQLFTFAFVILVLFKTDSPLAALGSALIMWAMWTAVIGEAPNLRNSGVTFTLVVFLVAWTLWDLFYNYSRET